MKLYGLVCVEKQSVNFWNQQDSLGSHAKFSGCKQQKLLLNTTCFVFKEIHYKIMGNWKV